MVQKSEQQEQQEKNKNYSQDCIIDISLVEYRVNVCYIKNNFLDPENRLEGTIPDLTLLN